MLCIPRKLCLQSGGKIETCSQKMNTETTSIPEGFERLERGGPFFTLLGPVYGKPIAKDQIIVGLRLETKHMNGRGVAHGGMLVTLADSALGMAILNANGGKPCATVNLSTDFMAAARVGDWLEAYVEIQRMGSRLVFATCNLQVGERRILRANAVFSRLDN